MLFRDNKLDLLREKMNDFDSFEDWPWPLLYKEIDQWFPGSKFILTVRKTPETWFNSLCKHAERTGPTKTRKEIYGFELPHEHKSQHIDFYLKHNQEVRDYFSNREADFIEVCWEDGDGWESLAKFLNKPIPNIPFPHADPYQIKINTRFK